MSDLLRTAHLAISYITLDYKSEIGWQITVRGCPGDGGNAAESDFTKKY